MGDWTRQDEHSWPTLDALTWPVRRWVCDRLVGQQEYSRNVATTPVEWIESSPFQSRSSIYANQPAYATINGLVDFVEANVQPFDQECP